MAGKRTITECRPWHFKQSIQMALQEDDTGMFWNSMTEPQKLATRILVQLEEVGASLSQIRNIKKVFLWEDDIVEYILYQPDPGFAQMIASGRNSEERYNKP